MDSWSLLCGCVMKVPARLKNVGLVPSPTVVDSWFCTVSCELSRDGRMPAFNRTGKHQESRTPKILVAKAC